MTEFAGSGKPVASIQYVDAKLGCRPKSKVQVDKRLIFHVTYRIAQGILLSITVAQE